jgi:hypothetical protein
MQSASAVAIEGVQNPYDVAVDGWSVPDASALPNFG